MTVITKSLTTDASGDATTTINVQGYINTIGIVYSASADAGTDVTITGYIGSSSFTVYSKTDYNTTHLVRPRVAVQDNAGTDLTYDGTRKVSEAYFVDRLVITFAQGGASKTNTVNISLDKVY